MGPSFMRLALRMRSASHAFARSIVPSCQSRRRSSFQRHASPVSRIIIRSARKYSCRCSGMFSRQREDSAMSEQRVKRVEVIGGDEYEVGSMAHAAAVKRRDGEVEDLEKVIEKLEKDLEEAK